MMYQKILFAVGEDSASDAAVPVVAAYARHLKADLHVLHVHRVGVDVPDGQIRAMLTHVVERLGAMAHLDRSQTAPFSGIRYAQEDGTRAQGEFRGGPGLGIRRTALTRALSFIAVGALLLTAGFFYQRLVNQADGGPDVPARPGVG